VFPILKLTMVLIYMHPISSACLCVNWLVEMVPLKNHVIGACQTFGTTGKDFSSQYLIVYIPYLRKKSLSASPSLMLQSSPVKSSIKKKKHQEYNLFFFTLKYFFLWNRSIIMFCEVGIIWSICCIP
jgi:hypothetical protein